MKSLLLLTIVFILGCSNQSMKTSGQAQSSPISNVSQMLVKSGRTATLYGVATLGGKGYDAALQLSDGTIVILVMMNGADVPEQWPKAALGRSMKATGL